MEQILNAGHELLGGLWESLHKRMVPPRQITADKLFEKFNTSRWAFINDLEDALCALDPRLDFRLAEVLNFVRLLDIKLEMICFTPRSRQSDASFFEGIRVAEAAYLLITLERLGFMTFPERLTDLIVRDLKNSKQMMLTSYELAVLRYGYLRHKDLPLSLSNDPQKIAGRKEVKSFVSALGYKVEATHDSEGKITMLTASAPKYREKKTPVLVTCPECGFSFERGDPDSSYQHRRAHKKVMYYLQPEPHSKFLAERNTNPNPELVRADSPKWKHKEMYLRARAFNREMGYEAILWGQMVMMIRMCMDICSRMNLGKLLAHVLFGIVQSKENLRSGVYNGYGFAHRSAEMATCRADGKVSGNTLAIFMSNHLFQRKCNLFF